MSRRIVNIVNFVRGYEPRDKSRDLIKPVVEEIALNKKYNLPNTFLLQYDALISEQYQEIFKREADENMEIGIWIECVRQLIEACGLTWRGDPDVTWDWHVVPGFLMAYTQAERKLIVDVFMSKFMEIFGYLPKVVGSWMLDSWSIDYMSKEYGIKAFVICREQYGVDAYTLWGGYMNQGYYPSKKNILCPAQTEENQVATPVFRMLGPDPIYVYDEAAYNIGFCATLEPVWASGHDEEKVDSIFSAYFEEECMDYSYVTLGQENPFGWEKIRLGLPMQLEKIDKLRKENKIVVEKLSETGEWFKRTHSKNSVGSFISHSDWAGNGIKSVWFNSPLYRANLLLEKDSLYFRDINKYDENYEERYLVTPCETPSAIQDNLPVVDGRMWNGDGIRSGLKFKTTVSDFTQCKENDTLICEAKCPEGKISIILSEEGINIIKPADVLIYFERARENDTQIEVKEKQLCFVHNGYGYDVNFDCTLQKTESGYDLGEGITDINIKF